MNELNTSHSFSTVHALKQKVIKHKCVTATSWPMLWFHTPIHATLPLRSFISVCIGNIMFLLLTLEQTIVLLVYLFVLWDLADSLIKFLWNCIKYCLYVEKYLFRMMTAIDLYHFNLICPSGSFSESMCDN